MTEVSLVKLPSDDRHWTLLMITTLVQVMAWCHQATSHYLSQCWPRSMLASPGLIELMDIEITTKADSSDFFQYGCVYHINFLKLKISVLFMNERSQVYLCRAYNGGFSEKLWYLHCINNGVTTVLHQAIDFHSEESFLQVRMSISFYWAPS